MRLTRPVYAVGITCFLLVALQPSHAGASSDHAAALLVYPYIAVDTTAGTDTLVQISNTSDTPVGVRCLYEGAILDPIGGVVDLTVADFQFQLTARQPIGWRASQGLAAVPLSNDDSSQIPAIPTQPFTGILRCVAIDRNLVPVERNVLVGAATLGQRHTPNDDLTEVAAYNAIGLAAHVGVGNGDDTLVLGGPDAEYDACPNFSVIPHFFDSAIEPAGRASSISTTLVLVPCSDDLAHTIPGHAVATFEVFNEFGQRFGTSQAVTFQQVSVLSAIGGVINPDRSIFNVQVAGTLTGQTRIQSAAGSGMLALAIETYRDLGDPTRTRRAAFNAYRLGVRDQPDTFVLPASTPQPTSTATRIGTPTSTRQVLTPTPTAAATASSTRTFTATGTPSVTPPAPSPTPTVAPSSSGGCSVAMQQGDGATVGLLLLGPALALLRRRRASRE